MWLSRSVVVLAASTAAVSAIVFVASAQQAPTPPALTWTPESLHAWVVEEFQGEPDVAALIRDVIATYGELRDAWNSGHGEADPVVQAIETRKDELMAKYLALWNERHETIRRRAPAEVKTQPSNPLMIESRIQSLFKSGYPVSALIESIVAVDQEIDQRGATLRDRLEPAFRAALGRRSDLTARYNAFWSARYDELRRRVLANDKDAVPADFESKIDGELSRDRTLHLLTQELQTIDREVAKARKAGRGRDVPELKGLEQRQAELWTKYDAAWRARYDEFRRRSLAGTEAFASWRVDAGVGDLFQRDPDVVALGEQWSATYREMSQKLDPFPTRRDEAARDEFEARKAALSAKQNALRIERYPALYKQALAELQSKFTPKPEAPDVVANHEGRPPKGGRPLTKRSIMPGGTKPLKFAPVPETIADHVSGVARDERDQPIAKAAVTLYSVTSDGPKPAATTTTDAEGRYDFQGINLPDLSDFKGDASYSSPSKNRFLVLGAAPGKGIAWGQELSMWKFNHGNMKRNGGGGHLFHKSNVTLDLKFGKAAVLQGKVVDEKGEPIPGATIRVASYAEFDDGRESTAHDFESSVLPDGVGRCRTGADGGFRIEGLTERVCYKLVVRPPDSLRTEFSLYATAIDDPHLFHKEDYEWGMPIRQHVVRANPITITVAKLRLIEVRVVAEDDGRPVAGARLKLQGGSSALRHKAVGDTDAAGFLRLSVPPGPLGFLGSDPPVKSRFLPSYLGKRVDVEPGDAPLTIEVTQKVGAELVLEAVEAGTGKPMADVFFWWTVEKPIADTSKPDRDVSNVLQESWTNAKGELLATVAPAPGRRYRFHFGGMREPVTSSFSPDSPRTYGYQASPAQSEPVELVAGKLIHLRFELRKGPPDPNPKLPR